MSIRPRDQGPETKKTKECKYQKLRSGSPKRDLGKNHRKEYPRRRLILLHTTSSFQALSESGSEESIYDYEAEEPSTSKHTVDKTTKAKQRICTSES